MSYRARHFLREWREHKGFTLEELAERVEAIGSERNQAEPDNLTFPDTMTHVTLSRIETGKQPYKQQLLEILAEIYGTDPASLIMRNPTDRNAIWSIYEQLPAEKKQEAVTYLQYLAEKRDGTNG